MTVRNDESQNTLDSLSVALRLIDSLDVAKSQLSRCQQAIRHCLLHIVNGCLFKLKRAAWGHRKLIGEALILF